MSVITTSACWCNISTGTTIGGRSEIQGQNLTKKRLNKNVLGIFYIKSTSSRTRIKNLAVCGSDPTEVRFSVNFLAYNGLRYPQVGGTG